MGSEMCIRDSASIDALIVVAAAVVRAEELHRRAYNASFEHYELTIDGVPLSWSVEYYDVLANTVGGGKPKMKARSKRFSPAPRFQRLIAAPFN